jgi:hypothetical protein
MQESYSQPMIVMYSFCSDKGLPCNIEIEKLRNKLREIQGNNKIITK